MTKPELFKYDVRVRERMLRKGAISDSEVAGHLEGLADLDGRYDELVLRQPALQHGDSGATRGYGGQPAPTRSSPPPTAAAASSDDLDEEWGDSS
jgi:hypothetical protein